MQVLFVWCTYILCLVKNWNRFALNTISVSTFTALNDALTAEVQRLKVGDAGSSSNLPQQMQLHCQNQMHKQQQGEQIPFYQLEQRQQNGVARNHESKWSFRSSGQSKSTYILGHTSNLDDVILRFLTHLFQSLVVYSFLRLSGQENPPVHLWMFFVLFRFQKTMVVTGESVMNWKFFCSILVYSCHCAG